MKNVIESLKEFVWDILGYLIPGAFFLITMNLCIKPDLCIPKNFLIDWELFENTLVIISCYILGYIVYSLTELKNNFQDSIIKLIPNKENFIIKYVKTKHSQNWESNFINSELFKASKLKLIKEYPNIEKMKITEIRNILISKNPEQTKILYTFKFRALMFDHISTIFTLIGAICFIQLISTIEILKNENSFKYLYVLMFLMIPLLGNSKRFFYPKSMRIPFSN